MKIVVINGTEVKGCTYQIKEAFLEKLRHNNEIQEFYLPKDMPCFCCGCKTCFFKIFEYSLLLNYSPKESYHSPWQERYAL